MSPIGTDRLYRPVPNLFRCWRLTGCAAAVPVLLMLTNAVIRVVATSSAVYLTARGLTPSPRSKCTAKAYGTGHDCYIANLRRIHGWFREAWFGVDDRAQAMRAREMPLFAKDPLRVSDFIGARPDAPSDEAARGGSSRKIRVTN
jgi:hypothetical protein